MSAVCATPGCERFREPGASFCADHAPKTQRPTVPFSQRSGCGLALVVMIAAVLLGALWAIVRTVL